VALARALASGPALLLLDEPLSALDHATRFRLRHELRRELVSGGVPSIVVTHDRMEAVGLGDWMAVIVDGRIRQAGPVQEVFRHPADAQVAESVGVENVLPVQVMASDGGLLALRVGAAGLECLAGGEDFAARAVPLAAWACIRAEDVTLTRDAGQASSARNRLAGRVRTVQVEGPLARVEMDCGFPLVAAITAQSAADMGLRTGEAVCAVVKATAIHLIPE
jgi:molybdate transport system ATP-binding protein